MPLNILPFLQLLVTVHLLLVGADMLRAQSFPEPLSPRTASYDMDIFLDVENKQVQAKQRLTFINPSADTLHNMRFHMYYNAWKNNKTDFFTETVRIPRTKPQDEIEDCIWSWIEVTKVVDEQGNDLTAKLQYVQPDGDNVNDHTVLDLQLTEPVLPYATYRLEMDWQSQIPPLMIRTGFSKDYFFMVQWYPKLGVYEPAGSRFAVEGQWNCHQYHPSTEYFGEFGVYDVQLNVPTEYVVGASGFLVEQQEEGDRTTYRYLAEDVIDFAWTAHPGFEVVKDKWRDVDITLLVRPEHRCNEDRFLQAAKHTLNYLADYLEPYPYPTLTIVSPPFYGLNSGAMEYPTLVTVPTLCNLPKGIKTTETLVIHELIHQYFMQMVASNEQEEPWLDEGFTSYFEAKILDKYYPEGTVAWPFMDVRIGSQELRRGRFFNAPNIKVNPISDYGWHFKHGSYAQIVYGKAAVGLRTLEGIVGEDCMQKIMYTYFQRWKFKHPCSRDFEEVAIEVAGQEGGAELGLVVGDFLQQMIYGTTECDYSIHEIINKPVTAPVGFFDNTEDCENDTTIEGEQQYEAKVIVFRNGEFATPQEVQITFDDGEQITESWDGKGRSQEWVYVGDRKIVSAEIDPDFKIAMDRNVLNNSLTQAPEQTGIFRYFVSVVGWLQSIMANMSLLA
ncbi:MAG: M1 family metallopeptidase [Bacteroidota bacterium]